MGHIEYQRLWRAKNREHCNAWAREYRRKNIKRIKARRKQYEEENPWVKTCRHISVRCSRTGDYGKKGIKSHLTLKDLEYLWFRDKAHDMKKPSIDRKNNLGDYTIENCRYMELKDNNSRPKDFRRAKFFVYCQFCGKSVYVPPSRRNRKKYCSIHCSQKNRWKKYREMSLTKMGG